MRAEILKPINHVYSIFKVYLALAVGGALVVVGGQTLAERPLLLLFLLIPLLGIALGWLVFVAGNRLKSGASEERRARDEAFAGQWYRGLSYPSAELKNRGKSLDHSKEE